MTVLVTGGAGYIGSHTVLELLDRGEAVVVLDDLSTGFWWAVPQEVKLVQGDIADQALVEATIRSHGVTDIAHFAAKIVVPESVSDPLGYYASNTMKTRALIESAVRTGVQRFIFSSTAAVYGEPDITPITENAPKVPINPYGRSKLMSEWMLQDASAAHGLSTVILRYFNVAGADPKGRSGQSGTRATHLLKLAAQAALGQRSHLEVYGTDYPTRDGSCLRDFIQVTDLARAHLAALDYLRDGGTSDIFNAGYGEGVSVLEMIDTVKRISGTDFPVKLSPRRSGDPAALIAGVDRIREVLGWVPHYNDLDAIVRQALDWEKQLKTRNAA